MNQEGMDEGQTEIKPEDMDIQDEGKENERDESGSKDVTDENISNIKRIHEAIRRFAERGATPLEKYDVDGQDINKTKTFLFTLRELFSQPDTFETAVVLFLQLKSIYDATTFVGALRELEEVNQIQSNDEERGGETIAQDNVNNQDVENKTSEEVDEMAKLKEIIELFNAKFKFSDGEVTEENIENKIEHISKALKVMTIKSINLEMELAKQKIREKLINGGVSKEDIERFIEKADELQNEILTQLEEGEEISQEAVNEYIDKLNELSSEFLGKEKDEGEGIEGVVDVDADYESIDRKGSVKTEEDKISKKDESLFEKALYEI